MSARPARRPGAVAAWLLDVLAVLVFAAIGRRSHDEGPTVGGS